MNTPRQPRRTRPGRSVRMTVGLAVRAAAMDCEATQPTCAVLVWQSQDGRVHKRALVDNPLLEEGLLVNLQELPLGSTKPLRSGQA